LKHLSAESTAKIGAQALTCADSASLGEKEATSAAEAALATNPDLTEQDAVTCLGPLRVARRADLIEPLFAAVAQRHALSPAGLRRKPRASYRTQVSHSKAPLPQDQTRLLFLKT